VPPSTRPSTAIDSQSSTSQSFNANTQTGSLYPFITSSDLILFSSNYVMPLVSVLQALEPSTFSQAQQYPEWVLAIEQELTALEQNGTWILTDLPLEKRALTSKWVYKTKFRPDGIVKRHNARLVIRGFE